MAKSFGTRKGEAEMPVIAGEFGGRYEHPRYRLLTKRVLTCKDYPGAQERVVWKLIRAFKESRWNIAPERLCAITKMDWRDRWKLWKYLRDYGSAKKG